MPQIRLVFLLLTLKNVILFSNSTEPDEFCGWKKGVMMAFHVLIVDDDPAICKLLSKVMISNEMEPLVVNSGAAALDLIARQSDTLDMILMDITLGDMEGFDVIQTIRRNGVTTPVIIISGRSEDYDFMYGLSLGADDYVTKPFRPQILVPRSRPSSAAARASRRRTTARSPAGRSCATPPRCAFTRTTWS